LYVVAAHAPKTLNPKPCPSPAPCHAVQYPLYLSRTPTPKWECAGDRDRLPRREREEEVALQGKWV